MKLDNDHTCGLCGERWKRLQKQPGARTWLLKAFLREKGQGESRGRGRSKLAEEVGTELACKQRAHGRLTFNMACCDLGMRKESFPGSGSPLSLMSGGITEGWCVSWLGSLQR